MNAHRAFAKPAYAGMVAIRKAIAAAKAAGLDVAGVEVLPDGTIRVMEARAVPTQPQSLFDQLDAAGEI